MKTRLIIAAVSTVLSIELGFIIFSVVTYYRQKKSQSQVLGVVSVVPVHKEFLVSSSSGELMYFSEPPPSVTQQDRQDWLPYVPTYTINSDTLNEVREYTVEKPENVYRIITLGDSFTFGHYVNTKDNWTELLEEKLNAYCATRSPKKIEIINLGERGYDVKYAGHRLVKRGMKYNPDLILYFESTSGFDRNRELYDPLILAWEDRIRATEASLSAHDVSTKAWIHAENDVHSTYNELQLFEEIHQAWSELLAARGDTPIVIASFNDLNLRNLTRLKLWTLGHARLSLFLGVRDVFALDGILPDGHPNTVGHTMIADDIYSYLIRPGILQCQ